DIVTGEITLTTVDPPRPLRARQDFNVDRMEVKGGDSVAAAQVLLVAKTLADFVDVSSLDTKLFMPGDESIEGLAKFNIPSNWNLGEIQEAAYDFQEKQKIYNNLRERSLDDLSTRDLQARIATQERYIRRQRNAQGELEDRVIRFRDRLNREEQLAADGIDNRDQLVTAQRDLEVAEDNLQRSRADVHAASFDIELMRNQIESYRSGRSGTLSQASIELRNSYDALRAAVSQWMQNYTIMSPVKGVVLLDREIRPNAYILRGDEVATVIPANAGDMIGRIDLPVKGSGAVAEGQKVMVRFASYPHLEYGSVEGRVIKKGKLESKESITVEVEFPNQLLTTTGNRLEAGPRMVGQASIITEEKPLLKRFLDRF
ncbi:MAG: HlyD family efflux transporter periplasmic adaptor subunit, partial [Bacteroidota bacterium]